MLEFKKDTLDARLNMSISREMELKLYAIAKARKVSVSLVAREIIDDFLRTNFEKIGVSHIKSKPKRRYSKRHWETA